MAARIIGTVKLARQMFDRRPCVRLSHSFFVLVMTHVGLPVGPASSLQSTQLLASDSRKCPEIQGYQLSFVCIWSTIGRASKKYAKASAPAALTVAVSTKAAVYVPVTSTSHPVMATPTIPGIVAKVLPKPNNTAPWRGATSR